MLFDEYLSMLGINEQQEKDAVETFSMESLMPVTLQQESNDLSFMITQAELDFDRISATIDLLERLGDVSQSLAGQKTNATFSDDQAQMLVTTVNAKCFRQEGEVFSFSKEEMFTEQDGKLVLNNKGLGSKLKEVGTAVGKAISRLWEALKKFFFETFSPRGRVVKLGRKLQASSYDVDKSFTLSDAMKGVYDSKTKTIALSLSDHLAGFSNFSNHKFIKGSFETVAAAVKSDRETRNTKTKIKSVKMADYFMEAADDTLTEIGKTAGATFFSTDDGFNTLVKIWVDDRKHLNVQYTNPSKIESSQTNLKDIGLDEKRAQSIAARVVENILEIDKTYGKVITGSVKDVDSDGTLTPFIRAQMNILKGTVSLNRSALAVLSAAVAG